MMDEADWWSAQEAEPLNLTLLAQFSDWLQERGDDRWEAATWLYEARKTGLAAHRCYYSCGANWYENDYDVTHSWYWAASQYEDAEANRHHRVHRRHLLRAWEYDLSKRKRAELWEQFHEWWIPPEKRTLQETARVIHGVAGSVMRFIAADLDLDGFEPQIGLAVLDRRGGTTRLIGHISAVSSDGIVDVIILDPLPTAMPRRSVELWERTYSTVGTTTRRDGG